MFFIVFFAFAQLGYLLFGTQVRGQCQFWKELKKKEEKVKYVSNNL
jgi:hypothetical protein